MYVRTALLTFGLLQVHAQTLPEIRSAGYTMPLRPRFAPGQVLTLFVPGLSVSFPSVPTTINASTIPLPTTLAGVTVTAVETSRTGGFSGNLPIFGITNVQFFGGVYVEGPRLTAVTVQMPSVEFCPPEAGPNPCWYIPVLSVTVLQSGVPLARSEMVAVTANPHVLNSCDTSVSPFLPQALVLGQLMAECDPIIAHADGTIVTARNPAQLGESVTIYATGLGQGITSALIGTPAPDEGVRVDAAFVRVGFEPTPLGIPLQTEAAYVGLTGGLIGIYQINVMLPPTAAANGDRTCSGLAQNMNINLFFTASNSVVPVRLCVKLKAEQFTSVP